MLRTEIIQIAKILHQRLDALEVHLSLPQIPVRLLHFGLVCVSSHWKVGETISLPSFDERQTLRAWHLGNEW